MVDAAKVKWLVYSSFTKDFFAQARESKKAICDAVFRGIDSDVNELPLYKVYMRDELVQDVYKSGELMTGCAYEKLRDGFALIDKITEVDAARLQSMRMQVQARKKSMSKQ